MAWLNSFCNLKLVANRKAVSASVGTALFFCGSLFLAGCFKQESILAVPETPLIARGRTTYQTFCIACHNADPRRPGAVGPDIAFSSKELLTLRLMEAKYPEGYKPKRPGTVMPAMPQLKEEIDGLHEFLNALKKGV